MRRLLLTVLTFTIFITLGFLPCYSQTLRLKSGRVVNGRIIEKTDSYVRIDFYGVSITYFTDEIEAIDESPVVPIDDYTKQEEHFLWKVSSQANTIYLLGSVHIAKKDLYPLADIIEDAFRKSDILVVEADISNPESETQKFILDKAVFKDNLTLKDSLPENLLELTKDKFTALNIPLNTVEKFQPWYIALMLQELIYQKLGYYPVYGIDNYFLNKAKGTKNIFQLESLEYQINLLSGLSKEEQELFLYYTIISLDQTEKQMDKIIGSWRKGDIEAMDFLLIKSLLLSDPRLQPLFEKIINKRNREMAEKIEQYLNTRWTYFVVVGAGHLIGQEGIVQLLEQKGYAIEQL